MKFDDDVVSPITSEDVLRLSGGGMSYFRDCFEIELILFVFCLTGDWHCAYVLLYGPRILEVTVEEAEKMEE